MTPCFTFSLPTGHGEEEEDVQESQELPETIKVNHSLRNVSCSSKLENLVMFKYFLNISIPRKSTLEMFYYMVEFVRFFFSLPNQFIVTVLTCNIDENLFMICFYIKSNLEKKICNRKHILSFCCQIGLKHKNSNLISNYGRNFYIAK